MNALVIRAFRRRFPCLNGAGWLFDCRVPGRSKKSDGRRREEGTPAADFQG
jgi:hypothetical protein